MIKKLAIFLTFFLIILFSFLFFYKGTLTILINKKSIVKIDQKIYEDIDSHKIKLRPGKYKITITKEGYKDFINDIEITFNKHFTLNVKLEPMLEELEDQVYFPQISTDKNYIYFVKNNALLRINLGTKETKSFSDSFPSIDKIFWSHDCKKAIIFSLSASTKNIYLYDLESKETIDLDKNIQSPIAWSPDDKNIAYIYNNSDYSSLNISEPGGENRRTLATEILDSEIIKWSAKNQILAIPLAVDEPQPSYIITVDNNSKKEINKSLTGAIFSPSGNKIVYEEATNSGEINIEILNLDDGSTQKTNIKNQLKKIALSEDGSKLYYISSTNSIVGSLNPIKEYLGIIDLNINEEAKRITFPEKTNGEDLMISNNKIFFMNNNTLYSYIIED